MSVNIKWIPGDDTATSAAAAGELATLDFGTIQIQPQEESGGEAKVSFKIGNTGSSTAENIILEFTGENSEAVSWKTLSDEEEGSYSSTLEISDLDDDDISDELWAKSVVPYDATTGSHSTYLTAEYTYI